MFKSYLISGIRNLSRNAISSSINILGLSIAIACAITIFVLEDSFYNLDAMHSNANRIALVVNNVKNGEGIQKWAPSPFPLAELLAQNSGIEATARACRSQATIRVGDVVFHESILFVDPSFMDIFSFEISSGDRQALRKKSNVMLSETMAVKYFGSMDVVGQNISLKFSETDKYEFIVGAVLKDTPANSSMYFDFLVPSTIWIDINKADSEDWSKNVSSLFVLKEVNTDWNTLNTSFTEYKTLQNQANTIRPLQHVELIPLPDVAQESWQISGALSWSNAPAAMVAIFMIGLFLILLACFNYLNLAIATVSTRLKEIGIRKVVGGGRKEIVIQFLTENLILCSIALIIGTGLAYLILVPGFNEIFPVKIEFAVSTWQLAITFFIGLLLFIAILSGIYPALYVSSFSAVKIITGRGKLGSKSRLSKIMLSTQFTLSIAIMISSLLFVAASNYFEGIDWGYDPTGTLVVQLKGAHQYEELKSQMANDIKVNGFAGATQHIGKSNKSTNIRWHEKEYSAKQFSIGFDYLETMNMRLSRGRLFNEAIESDKLESAIVNETLVKELGWENPINQEIEVEGTKKYVVGVVDDFYFNDFYRKIEPVIFTVTPDAEFKFMVLKVDAENIAVAKSKLQSEWKKIAPDEPSSILVQSNIFDNFVQNSKANNQVMYFVSMVAVVLAAVGLYGLVSYNLMRRLKELSVRRVFGANSLSIFRYMSNDYVWIIAIAFLIGAPMGAFLMEQLLRSIYPTDIPSFQWPYWVAVGVMVLTIGLTVGTQLIKVIKRNPVTMLRID